MIGAVYKGGTSLLWWGSARTQTPAAEACDQAVASAISMMEEGAFAGAADLLAGRSTERRFPMAAVALDVARCLQGRATRLCRRPPANRRTTVDLMKRLFALAVRHDNRAALLTLLSAGLLSRPEFANVLEQALDRPAYAVATTLLEHDVDCGTTEQVQARLERVAALPGGEELANHFARRLLDTHEGLRVADTLLRGALEEGKSFLARALLRQRSKGVGIALTSLAGEHAKAWHSALHALGVTDLEVLFTRLVSSSTDPGQAAAATAGVMALLRAKKCPQTEALRQFRLERGRLSEASTPNLQTKLQGLSMSKDAVDTLRTWCRHRAPLIINFPLDCARAMAASGSYQNQFETYTSRAGVNHALRRSWESKLFLKTYDGDKVVAAQRPRYGTLNAPKYLAGITGYGRGMFVLHDHMRAHTTITPGDSARKSGEHVGLLSGDIDHVLAGCSSDVLRQSLAAALGDPRDRRLTGRTGQAYIEAQYHRPLHLAQDVKKIVLLRTLVDDKSIDDVTALARTVHVPLVWRGPWCCDATNRNRTLNTIHKHGWEVGAWSTSKQHDQFVFVKSNHDAQPAWRHVFIKAASDEALAAELQRIGNAGQRVVGVGRRNNGLPLLLVKAQPEIAAGHYHYIHAQTADPYGVIREREQAGWRLHGLNRSKTKRVGREKVVDVVVGRNLDAKAESSWRHLEIEVATDRNSTGLHNALSYVKRSGDVVAFMTTDTSSWRMYAVARHSD